MPPFKFEHRDYQVKAVESVLDEFSSGRESVLLESPVGSGKTIMGLMVIQALQKENPNLKVNWVASRRHILQQTEAINSACFHCKIQYVSVFANTIPKADLVVLDEAHHEATQSCVDMYEKAGNKLTLGLSATPLRTDRMKLAFQVTIPCGNIQYFINSGVLSPIHSYKIQKYNVETMAKLYLDDPQKWGKTIAFFSLIDECRAFQRILLEHGIVCDVVTGQSNKDTQLAAFADGKTQVVANVSVLTEGFDLPDLQTVFLRDASRLPTIQMAGRGLRRADGKTHCNIVQSAESSYQVEKIAKPAENFRYRNEKWLSCSGDTQAVLNTVEQSLALMEDRKTVLPAALKHSLTRMTVKI